MISYDDLFEIDPFSLSAKEKKLLRDTLLSALSEHHKEHCQEYRRLSTVLGDGFDLPVRLFKEYDLMSISPEDIVKTMTSSGTSGQAVSKIYLDRDTSSRQTKALARIVTSVVGKSRPPLLVIDSKSVIKNRAMFSARGAGILGFSMLGRDVTYALDENMELDYEEINLFYERHQNETVMLFGFTYMIWQHFCQALQDKKAHFDLSGVLIHGGGWKKLVDQSVDNEEFKKTIESTCGISRVHNYYGMVEQTGSIFMECEAGHLHASVFSDIDFLDPQTLTPSSNKKGIIRSISFLPTSYPGHVLLTEDEGALLGEDDCPCGRKGKYFEVYGRVKGAEIRGCSDTYGDNK